MSGEPRLYPPIRIGDVFPSDDPAMTALTGFLVAGHSLLALARLQRLLPDDHPFEDASAILFMTSIGALSETARCLPALEEHGWFKIFEAELEQYPAEARQDLTQRLQRIRTELSGTEESHLRRFLRRTRNKAAYHWDAREIKRVLRDHVDWNVAALKDFGRVGSAPVDYLIPLAVNVPFAIMKRIAGSDEAKDDAAAYVAQLQGDVFHVMLALYVIALRRAGVDLQVESAGVAEAMPGVEAENG